MPFGRKIQQNRRPARSGMINDMTCILQISVLHQNFHAASNVQKNKKEKLMGEKDITEKILVVMLGSFDMKQKYKKYTRSNFFKLLYFVI